MNSRLKATERGEQRRFNMVKAMLPNKYYWILVAMLLGSLRQVR